ncbi:MAG: hypothetical protein JNL48_00080 [Acidobacteria bacterium]|nr:hypothetical protein [Acidobacteriota bacterium]
MPYLRLTADRRGVEHTFLLHVAAPGERPKILYWYRTVPGVKVGRPALDDAAMRALEEQYPHIDFDWPYILDVGSMTPVEVEAPIPPRKRKPRRPDADDDLTLQPEAGPGPAPMPAPQASDAPQAAAPPPPVIADDHGPDLLSELLGRGIAASLREQFTALAERIEATAADPAVKAGWRDRLARLDPDGWESPEAVLAGMSSVQPGFDAITAELDRAADGA